MTKAIGNQRTANCETSQVKGFSMVTVVPWPVPYFEEYHLLFALEKTRRQFSTLTLCKVRKLETVFWVLRYICKS